MRTTSLLITASLYFWLTACGPDNIIEPQEKQEEPPVAILPIIDNEIKIDKEPREGYDLTATLDSISFDMYRNTSQIYFSKDDRIRSVEFRNYEISKGIINPDFDVMIRVQLSDRYLGPPNLYYTIRTYVIELDPSEVAEFIDDSDTEINIKINDKGTYTTYTMEVDIIKYDTIKETAINEFLLHITK